MACTPFKRGDTLCFCYDRTLRCVLLLPGLYFKQPTEVISVASSDATNIRTSIRQEGNEIVINGHKWWISGAGDPRCALHLVLGKSDPNNSDRYRQQSIVIVPANAPGVKVIRPMKVFGYDDAPEGHCEIIYDNVRVPLSNLVLGWGKGFEVCCPVCTDIYIPGSENSIHP